MLILALLSLLPSSPVQETATDWTGFRGPSGNGHLAERHFPLEWGPENNIAWTYEVPGSGWSSPIVVGDRVFLSSAAGPDEPMGFNGGVSDPSTMGRAPKPTEEQIYGLTCLNLANGEVIWQRDVASGVPAHPIHSSNTFATETPASDGKRLFVTYGALGHLVAFDLEGEELWRVDTGVYKTGNDFGWGISLATHGDHVFLQNDNEESSFLAAFHGETGEEIWRADRGQGTSWGTPLIWPQGEQSTLVSCGRDTVVGYDPATGAERWRVQGIGGSFSSSPAYDAERLYFGNSGPMSRGPLLAVPASAEGVVDLASEEAPIAWRQDRSGPGFASPVVYEDVLYVLASNGVLAAHDVATGERLWRERLPDAAQVVACPWVAGDELFILDELGTVFVIRCGREFELLATNQIEGLYWGTPSVAGDALLLREASKLYCIRE